MKSPRKFWIGALLFLIAGFSWLLTDHSSTPRREVFDMFRDGVAADTNFSKVVVWARGMLADTNIQSEEFEWSDELQMEVAHIADSRLPSEVAGLAAGLDKEIFWPERHTSIYRDGRQRQTYITIGCIGAREVYGVAIGSADFTLRTDSASRSEQKENGVFLFQAK